MLPSQPADLKGSLENSYVEGYLKEFRRPFSLIDGAVAWGAPEGVPKWWTERRLRHVDQVSRLVRLHQFRTFCDFSGGCGLHTFESAKHFDLVLHCDLSVESLSYACRKAEALGLRNVVFIRIDYFKPPFSTSLDVVICMDSLIRSEQHERMVLKAILRSLAAGGLAVVDFHNRWHNPLRRIGLLPENFRDNRSYTRAEAERLLREAGVERYDYHPFVQEVGARGMLSAIGRKIIPPTRLMYRIYPSASNRPRT